MPGYRRSGAEFAVNVVNALLLVSLAIAIGLGWACYRLLVDRGRLLLQLEAVAKTPSPPRGLAPGALLNDFALPTLDGRMVTFSALTGPPLLLALLQADCLYSRAFAQELRGLAREAGWPLPVLILSGDSADPERLAVFAGLPGALVRDADGQTAQLLRIAATPAGYLVDGNRRTASHLLAGPDTLLAAARGEAAADDTAFPIAVTALAARKERSAALVPLAPGDEAPDFTLPLLGGGAWSLRAHRGRPVTLLFSDPECPPCQRLLADLDGLNDERLVIVSQAMPSSSDWARLAADLAIPIAIQRHREVARAYGTLRTPSVFTIDATGKIAAGPGIGVAAALAIVLGNKQGGAGHG